jgi:hypothetical protein
MSNAIRNCTAALLLFSLWGLAAAHHGTGGFYDEKVKVRVEGVVKEFHWRNPHSGLFVIGKDPQGKEVTYALEMGSPNSLARAGYTRRTFKPGDHVVVEIRPSHVNPTAGELISSDVWVNGKRVSTTVIEQGAKSEGY